MLKNKNNFIFAILIFLFKISFVFGQLQNNNWVFGYGARIDFSGSIPLASGNTAINSNESTASVSDPSTGQLLFYTDGRMVWNANNQVMANGANLLGGYFTSCTQGALIVPFPNDNQRYYLFTLDELEIEPNNPVTDDGLRYSVVDMTLNGGLGDVQAANLNIPLATDLTEKLIVIRSPEIQGFWVIAHRKNANEFLAWKIDACGIDTQPVVSAVGSNFSSVPSIGANEGWTGAMDASPDGNRIGMPIDWSNRIEFFDFNKTSGVVSNLLTVNVTDDSTPPFIRKYGACFSPDGSKFYYTNTNSVYQLNLSTYTSAAIEASNTLIYSPILEPNGYPCFQIEQAPNNKLYVAIGNSGRLDEISNPNSLGLGCGYVNNVVNFGPASCQLGLPAQVPLGGFTPCNSNNGCDPTGNLVIYSNNDGGILTINVDQNIPNLKVGICTYEPIQVNFTGPFVGNITQVNYAGMNSNQNNNNCGLGNFTTSVTGVPAGIVTISPPMNPPPVGYTPAHGNGAGPWGGLMYGGSQCDTLNATGGTNTPDEIVYYFQNITGGTLLYHQIQYACWTNQTLNVSAGGNCCILPPNSNPCSPPVVTINQPASICSPQTVDLANSVTTSGSVVVSYYSTNANATSATNPLSSSVVSATGTYFVRVEQDGNSACYTVQQINVTVNAAPTITISPANPIICAGSSVQLTASGANSYSWANATGLNTTTGAIVIATISATTTYTVTGTTNGCSTDQTITITTGTDIVPTFQINPLCAGSNYSLPFTSTNNITGTWNQPFDNANSAQYTFTPDAGQCAVATTVSVTITQQTTPTFNSVNPICSGGQLNALPTTSTNSITGTWTPAINNTTTTTYTFTPDAGQCAAITNLTITVNQPVTPTFPPMATAYCQDAIIIQPILPLQSNEGINGTWDPVAISTANLGTTLYTFTPLPFPAQCATTYTMNVTVGTSILPTFDPVATICAGDQLSELPTTSTNGIQGTWLPPIVNNLITTTYTFVPNPDQCGTSTQLTINVNTPVITTFQPVAPVCAGTPIPPLSTTSDNGIIGTWSPAIDNTTTTTYTFTPSAGQCATPFTTIIIINQQQTPTFAQVAPICVGGTFTLPNQSNDFIPINGTWSPAINTSTTTTYTFTPDAGQCATQTNMTVEVNTATTPIFTQIAPICSGGTLSLPNQSNDAIPVSGTWSPAINNTASQVYTFTPTSGQCATTTTMNITVNPSPQAIISEIDTYCGLQNGSVNITGASGGTPPYQYNFNGQGFGTTQAFTNLAAGTYPVIVSDVNNCLYSVNVNIASSLGVDASFTATPMIGSAPSIVSFINNSSTGNNIDYYWYFGTNNDTTAFQPSNQVFTESGLYPVTLIVSNGNVLCNDTMTLIIKVEDKPYIVIPNIFTPNGDAINDLFLISSYGYTNLELFIYNRWGTLITNYDPTQKSWDGSGESEGTYFFILKGKKPDGSDLDVTGNILLVR